MDDSFNELIYYFWCSHIQGRGGWRGGQAVCPTDRILGMAIIVMMRSLFWDPSNKHGATRATLCVCRHQFLPFVQSLPSPLHCPFFVPSFYLSFFPGCTSFCLCVFRVCFFALLCRPFCCCLLVSFFVFLVFIVVEYVSSSFCSCLCYTPLA